MFIKVIWLFCKSEYFYARGLTLICPTERFWKWLAGFRNLFSFVEAGPPETARL
jgi:hypothetical protein